MAHTITNFLDDQTGAVSLDWVALSAGIVLMSLAVFTTIVDVVDFRVSHFSSVLSGAGQQNFDLTD